MENRPLLVVLESDPGSCRKREDALIRRYADIAEVQFITEQDFLDTYFAEDRNIDVILTDAGMFRRIPHPEKAGRIILLTGRRNRPEARPENTEEVSDGIQEAALFQKIDAALSRGAAAAGSPGQVIRETKIAAVYSPIGGCGKSLTALAVARKLRRLDTKVLVIGCDPMQSFSVYLKKEEFAGEDLVRQLKDPSDDTYWTILQNIRTDGISWLCPFEKSLSALQMGMPEWKKLLDILMAKKDFDVIILDLGTDMTPQVVELIGRKATLVMLTEANEIAGRKMQKLLKNPQILPKCKGILVANEYHSDGIRIAPESLFGTIAPYDTWEEALEDPVFYRIALQITE